MNNNKRCLWNTYAPFPLPLKHQRKWTKTANNPNFSKSKVNNSVMNCSTVPKIKLNVAIIMINLYPKLNFSKCNLCKENEQERYISRIFLRPRGITTCNLKIAWPYRESNLTYHYARFVYQFSYVHLLQENGRKL